MRAAERDGLSGGVKGEREGRHARGCGVRRELFRRVFGERRNPCEHRAGEHGAERRSARLVSARHGSSTRGGGGGL